jgi:hypothetical protein
MRPKKQGFWPRVNCSQIKLPDFESPSGDGLSKSAILDFQSEFSMSKIIRIFLKKKFIEEYQFSCTFFVKSIFC